MGTTRPAIDALRRAAHGMARHPWQAGFLGVAGFHLVVALGYKLALGLDICADPARNSWDFFWQALPMDAMVTGFWSSLWNLHAQPPLFNVFGFLLHAVFGAHFLQAMQYIYIVLGALLSGACYPVLAHLTRCRWLALVVALLLALNPPLFLYEAFILYTLPEAFLVVLAVLTVLWHRRTGSVAALAALMLVMNVLVLFRSVYNLALLVPVTLFALVLAGPRWPRMLALAVVMSLPAAAWYGKNYAKFGFFGASSWMGSNLWRIVTPNYDPPHLQALAAAGVLDPAAVELRYFDPPAAFQKYGFNATSSVPVLARNDYHNINMVAIARMHQRNAMVMIRRDPAHYLGNAWEAYQRFCSPSYETKFVLFNYRRMPASHLRVAEFFYGTPLMARLSQAWGLQAYSLYFFLIPLSLIGLALHAIARCRLRPAAWVGYLRENAVLVFCASLLAYVALIGSFLEYGENCRFKFPVEPLIWCCALGVAALWLGSMRHVARGQGPEIKP